MPLLSAVMSSADIAIIIVAFIGPIGAYFLAARKMSGNVGTSEAEQLWAESKAIRDWGSDQISTLTLELTKVRRLLTDALARIAELESEVNDWEHKP